ncbi:MAG: hypothetical protein LBR92_02900 [Puniceicoccales bacterium]|nr:hypothetical protein [Puniceicoccales bacterium]
MTDKEQLTAMRELFREKQKAFRNFVEADDDSIGTLGRNIRRMFSRNISQNQSQ